MQISRSVHAGDLLEIRRGRWRVLDVHTYERCQLITVAGIGPANVGSQRQFLSPFEAIERLDRTRSPRCVRPRRWRHACRGLLADAAPPGALRTAAPALIDLLPHQLEPALAVVRGRGSRVLLADEVGLGKTIQAGLIIAELQARGLADRVLIVTPSGLRDQWRSELAERFGLDTAVVDFRDLRRRSLTMAVGRNPWLAAPKAIASIDYVKRPEVLPSVRAGRWDVVVVDEAHGAGRDSERHLAVSALAARAAYVVLLTATPHNGDPRAFASLCGIGALADPLLVFRRTKTDVKLGAGRRIHQLQVRVTAAESRMHALLAEFTRVVRSETGSTEACLALAVLHKRAFSSARSLELTVGRRLEALGSESAEGLRQLTLPLIDHGGELDHADAPPDCLAALRLADPRRERRLLDALLEAARRATVAESKVSVLKRLLRRVAEPVVVFTEFRDTLLHLQAALRQRALILHGGLTRDQRRVALDDFARGSCRILLATDAAGEGLNLHHRCRLVINLELPWNPTRLEQRIGRVDRIGQTRMVHAIHLVARHTGEGRVLDRLRARIARAREDIAAANPVEEDERAIATAVIDPSEPPAEDPTPAGNEDEHPPGPERLNVDLREEAGVEVARIRAARSWSSDEDARVLSALEVTGPWWTRARLTSSRARLGRRVIALVRIDSEDGFGQLFDRIVVPISVLLTEHHRPDRLKALIRSLWASLRPAVENAYRPGYAIAAGLITDLLRVRLARERRIAATILELQPDALQPGLFDRRAERKHQADGDATHQSADEIAGRLEMLEQRLLVSPQPPRLLLLLVP